MDADITQTRLDNGLQVLLKEIHTAPLISHWVWYRVGSRNERPGITGASHWVEHMQFKGTPQFPANVLDRAIARHGGTWNALTYLDWTAYYETMPAGKIDLALRLEADRMQNSRFDPEDVDSERTVIISERQGNENEPLFQLGELVQAAAFRVHTYHHEVIGDTVDLETMTRDDLYAHYRRFYNPGNAVVAIAGDFETTEMLERVAELYGPIPAQETIVPPVRPEPASRGELRVSIDGPGETTYLTVAHHAPAGSNEDFSAYTVLDSLLTGPSNLNMFGGGLSNHTSRLYRSLVEKELAVSVYGGLQATIDPFLHGITIVVHPQRQVEEVLAALDDEFERLRNELAPVQELERAVKQARALFAYGSESITNQAFWLGYAEMFANYGWFTSYLDRLGAITPEDVQRIAQAYLRPHNRIIGSYLPENGKGAA